jgi:cation:H+ antiporter
MTNAPIGALPKPQWSHYQRLPMSGLTTRKSTMIILWFLAIIAGLGITIMSSSRTLDAAVTLSRHLGLSPFIIGLTIVAIGTDLPEIANSITASASGHGDINVGDSIGSVVTQITLILGLLCFIRPIRTARRPIAVAGAVTVASLLLGAALMDDEYLGRGDGLILLGAWMIGTAMVHTFGHLVVEHQETLFMRGVLTSVRNLVVGLAGVAIGAVMVVQGFIAVADSFGVPEYATSFLVLSLGTSIPELFVDGGALRKGQTSLAMGAIVGSSFIDATISLGIGPALFPVAVSANATTGSIIAAIAVAAAIGFLLVRRVHGRSSGFVLLALYASTYSVLLI